MRGLMLIAIVTSGLIASAMGATNDVSLVRQIEALRKENETLRKENQELRKLAVANHRKVNQPKAKNPAPLQVDDVVEVFTSETGYWLSAGGTRHNEKCRYYKNAKGRPCKKEDGRACKSCGG